MTLRRAARRAATVSALAAVAASAPAAAATWTAPSPLVEGDDAGLLGAAVRSDGVLRAAVEDEPRGIALGLADASGANGAFGAPLVALRGPARITDAELAADGSGVALEVRRGSPSNVIAFDAAGRMQPLYALTDRGSWTDVAISPRGAAIAAWVRKAAKGHEIVASFRDVGAASFSPPVRAGYTTDADTLVRAGIGDRGEAVVSWQVNSYPSSVAAAVRLPGAGFGRARFVTRDGTSAQLAVGAGGQAILVTSYGRRLRVAVKAPGAGTMPAAREIDAAADGYSSAVAAGGDRRVALAWIARRKGERRTRVRVYEGTRALRRIGTLGTNAGGEELGVAVDGTGATVASWEDAVRSRAGRLLGVAYRPAGGRFEPTTFRGPASLAMSTESLRLGAGGRAFVLYEAFEPGDDGGESYRRVLLTERRP